MQPVLGLQGSNQGLSRGGWGPFGLVLNPYTHKPSTFLGNVQFVRYL
jgi:hypothetical protein